MTGYRAARAPAHSPREQMTSRAREQAFQKPLDEHKRILYKICNSYCGNPDDRDDLAQEIVLQLWRSFGTFDDGYRFSTWMYRVALNVAVSFYRHEATRARHVISDEARLLETIDDRNESACLAMVRLCRAAAPKASRQIPSYRGDDGLQLGLIR